MSRVTSCICFCGAAVSRDDRRSSLFERACLEARLRLQLGDGPQALVLHFNAPLPQSPPLVRLGAYTVARRLACNAQCLLAEDLLALLRQGFDRIFLELSPDIRLIRHQIDLVEQIALGPGTEGKVALFHSEAGLRALLDHHGIEQPGASGSCVSDVAVHSSGRDPLPEAVADRGESDPFAQDLARHFPAGQSASGFGSGPVVAALRSRGQRAGEMGGSLGGRGAINTGDTGCVSLVSDCSLCGQCGWACPTGAIHLGEGGDSLEIVDVNCIGCGICAAACPDQALSILPIADLWYRRA